uniref:CARD domain-containing protein n=1 Tax=Plectus sambesii TaxID=2011161 RepID=A0A914W3E9_9BILA
MEALQRKAIENCTQYIVEDMGDVMELFPMLISLGYLTNYTSEVIKAEKLSYDKTKKLLEILVTIHKEDAFHRFIEILIKANKTHIASKLNDEYGKLGGEKLVDINATVKALSRISWSHEKPTYVLLEANKKQAETSENASNLKSL